MELLLLHPAVAHRDCGHCLKVWYDEETGKPFDSGNGKEHPRHAGCPVPCSTKVGCPKGTPENPKSLSEKNAEAYLHYLECKAVSNFPDDPIVRRNAGIIYRIEQSIERHDRQEMMQTYLTLAAAR